MTRGGRGCVEGWGGSTPKTDPGLLARLVDAARNHRMTPQDVFDQRVSFVWGQMRGSITKDQVRHVLTGGSLAEGWDD